MSTYLQLLSSLRRGERKRAYWVCGPERRLVEEVLDKLIECVDADPLNESRLIAGEVRDRDIWDELNQAPLDGERRLVVVREAERIRRWEQLAAWWNALELRSVHAIFVASDTTKTDVAHMRLFVERGKYVRCGPFSPPEWGKEDQRIAVFREHHAISSRAARLLLERTRGDMALALDFLRKCALFTDEEIDERVVAALAQVAPAEDYVESLIAFRKRDAINAAMRVDPERYGAVIGLLDYKLATFSRLYRAVRAADRHHDAGARRRDVMRSTGLEPFVVNELIPHVRRYDPTQVRTCYQALALADSRVSEGETDLVLEVLTSLWMARAA